MPAQRQPNLVLILTDDQRHDTVRALGNREIQTPHLDALVARGTAFTHAHIPGGTCGAICMPSRAMLHTGRTLFRIDREGQEIPVSHHTLGECLQPAGYETHGIGKWHNGRAGYARSFSGGDEIFFGGMWDHWNVPAYRFDPTGRYADRLPFVPNFWNANAVTQRECDHVDAGRHSTELFLDAGIRFLRGRTTRQPFFLFISFLAPHDPRTMPEKFRTMYDPAQIRLPENFAQTHPIDTGALRIRDELLAAAPRDLDEIRRHIAEYYAMISHLDDALGRLLACLRETGETENTIVVYTGDNGLAVGQHGLMGKQNLYEHSVRVPLILAGPGIPAAERRDCLTYLLDLYPTLCDLAGVPIPESVEGQSFRPCLDKPEQPHRDWLYLAYADTIRGVKNDRYKLIEYAAGGHRATQLFDLAQDPWETTNLASDREARPTLKILRRQLCRLRDEWLDPAHSTGATFWANCPDLR